MEVSGLVSNLKILFSGKEPSMLQIFFYFRDGIPAFEGLLIINTSIINLLTISK